MTSGLIAGESLVGVLLGLFAWLGVKSSDGIGVIGKMLGMSDAGQAILGQLVSVAALLGVAAWVFVVAKRVTARHETA